MRQTPRPSPGNAGPTSDQATGTGSSIAGPIIAHDPDLYKERHLVECFINKIKHFRRIATRYDKTAQAFMSMICITCMMV